MDLFFFEGCLSLVLLNKLFPFSSSNFAIKKWFTSTFLKAKLFHRFSNKKSILSSLDFLDFFQLIDFCNKIYNALFVCLLSQLLHCDLHNENFQHMKFYHVVFKFSFEHAIFSNFPSLFIHCLFLDSYLFLFEHLDLPHTHLWKLHHSYIFQLFHYSHLSYSHL